MSKRHGGDCRGSNRHRKMRKLWLLRIFGDGVKCACWWCGKMLDFAKLTSDRIVPGSKGGKYVHKNLVPACRPCNAKRFYAKSEIEARRLARVRRQDPEKQFNKMFRKGD